jgi:predicted enzyme related to lactoylglutathione lyase
MNTAKSLKGQHAATPKGNLRPAPVAWFEIAGKDGQRLRAFYADLFGWDTADVGPGAPYGVTDAAEGGIGGGIGAKPTGDRAM